MQDKELRKTLTRSGLIWGGSTDKVEIFISVITISRKLELLLDYLGLKYVIQDDLKIVKKEDGQIDV